MTTYDYLIVLRLEEILLLSICEILLLFFGGITAVWRPECMAACHEFPAVRRDLTDHLRNNIRRENHVAANSSV